MSTQMKRFVRSAYKLTINGKDVHRLDDDLSKREKGTYLIQSYDKRPYINRNTFIHMKHL